MSFRFPFGKKPVVFADAKTESQEFELKSAFTDPTPPSDASGFTDEPRGAFAGQESEFNRWGIKQLGRANSVWVARSDPRGIGNGILPKVPGNPVNVEEHRRSNESSGGLSFSTKLSAAIACGQYSSFLSQYGKTPIPGDGTFYVWAAKISGEKYSAAGPGRLNADESEVTVSGPVDAEDLLAYRQCKLDLKKRVALCSSIFVRKDVGDEEKMVAIDFLSGKSITNSR